MMSIQELIAMVVISVLSLWLVTFLDLIKSRFNKRGKFLGFLLLSTALIMGAVLVLMIHPLIGWLVSVLTPVVYFVLSKNIDRNA